MIWHSDMANTWRETVPEGTFSEVHMYGAAQTLIWRRREQHDKLAVCILDIHLIQIFEHHSLSVTSAAEVCDRYHPRPSPEHLLTRVAEGLERQKD